MRPSRTDQRIEEILSLTKGPRILDVGCAGGFPDRPETWLHGRLRARFGDQVWGTDVSEPGIRALQARGLTNLSVQDGQEFALDQEFDTVVLGEVIEHVTNPGGLLASAARHLKPTGRIVLTTPYVFGINNVLYALAKFPKTCSNPEHVQWFCPSTMAELAERHGLSVSTWHLCAAYAHPNRPLVAIFYLLMRTLGKLLPKRISATSMVFVLARENPGC